MRDFIRAQGSLAVGAPRVSENSIFGYLGSSEPIRNCRPDAEVTMKASLCFSGMMSVVLNSSVDFSMRPAEEMELSHSSFGWQ